MEQAALEEEKRKKPVISINSASYWHALRLKNIETRYKNYGRLLAEF
jgi:maleate cis-trans isomerase